MDVFLGDISGGGTFVTRGRFMTKDGFVSRRLARGDVLTWGRLVRGLLVYAPRKRWITVKQRNFRTKRQLCTINNKVICGAIVISK